MVLVADECRVQREAGTTAVWYPAGHYPQIRLDQKREAVSFYGCLNVKTGQCHSRQTRWQNSQETVKFLKQLETDYLGKRALLIRDSAPSHFKNVKTYLKGDKKWQLEILPLPPYSPELNPQEHVWKAARRSITHNSQAEFPARVISFSHYLRRRRFKANFPEKYLGV